ncbi:hypothetical protein P3X46_016091 [Hevea brasiliensis]|uniref:Transmembrane protein n=1 Tax=Hevea brasiliensis TaxID=3981 RepID=A0ABQ9M221_HEVBR|nr:uncharacterized protein LOC110640292 [Hevea brasiliensis]KAJ9172898.1 hypothetical protein P3X46_016091 [Hevea brasiliensis]
MASRNRKLLLLFSILVAFLSFSASARPCKTLFISSYSFSIKPIYPNSHHPSSSGFFTIVTEITQQRSSSEILLDRRVFPTVDDDGDDQDSQPKAIQKPQEAPVLPFGLSSYDMSSLRDRTKDILSVVVALLFGVGCGALTAATMYLVWSLFSTRYDYRYEEFDGEDGDEEDDLSAKKMGYGKIPEAGSMPKQVKEAV